MPVRQRSRPRLPHPLDHHAAYRALIAAAAPIAALTSAIAPAGEVDLASAHAVACSDLALGFAAPVGSRARVRAHHRAWVAIRELDRAVARAAQRRVAGADTIERARRAVDRADVMIGALPGVLAA